MNRIEEILKSREEGSVFTQPKKMEPQVQARNESMRAPQIEQTRIVPKTEAEPQFVSTTIKTQLAADQPIKKNKKTSSVKLAGILVLVLAVLIGGGYAGYEWYGRSQASNPLKVMEEVRKIIELPTDEEPTIATVSDLKPLQSQPFFSEAKIGDKVLIYSQTKRAVLYRPSEEKIIRILGDFLPAPAL